MANLISYDCKPQLRRPVFIEGLPGVGNVGKLAADLVAEQTGARRTRIYSDDLPPQVVLDGESVAETARNELWYSDLRDRDAVFLLGDFQGTTPAGQYNLSETVFRMILPHDPSLIVTLDGYGIGQLVRTPRVLGAVSETHLKPKMEAAGGFYPGEPKGGIAAAMIFGFGKMYGIDSVCIMGETSGYIINHRSAKNVVHALAALLGIDVDTSSFQTQVDAIEATSETAGQGSQSPQEEDDLMYIR